jgi:hypothetical protein
LVVCERLKSCPDTKHYSRGYPNSAAARFMLYGRLPPRISDELSRKDLHYFEFLLRGRHITREADYSVGLVAVR